MRLPRLRVKRSRLERVGLVHVVTLDDARKRNAIGHALAAELLEHAERLADARAVVIRGEGSTFSAGAGLPDVFGNERPTAEMREVLRSYYECFLRIRALQCPTFAAITGAAIGAGLNLALACDVRIAAPNAKLGATFTRIGLHPGGGCSFVLAEAVGRERALRVLLEGATVDAHDARAWGLVSEIADDPYARALELADNAAQLEPWLARSVKRAVSLGTFEAALDLEAWAQAESTHAPRFREWIGRFI